MLNMRKLIHRLIICLILLGTGSSFHPVQPVIASGTQPPDQPELASKTDVSEGQPGISPERTTTSDSFGYSINPLVPPAWIDITVSGTELEFSNLDDSYSEPVQIGFNFKFYENTYAELYVSTNGLITFGQGSDDYGNRPIPRDSKPDNLIAPFWDDLKLRADSHVYTYAGNDASGKYFVVEWSKVTRFDSDEQVTFETILYENGDILFQYQQLNGVINEASVGIEDGDGIDGLLFLYNASGLSVANAIQFVRPSPEPRAKLTPHVLNCFTSNLVAYLKVKVINTGEQGSDSYNLTVNSVLNGWSVSFHNSDTQSVLSDTNGDGEVDTGPIAQGGHRFVYLKIEAPPTAETGATIQLDLIATSALNPGKTAFSIVQAAVPASFAQAVFDPYAGMRLQLIWKENQIATRLTEKQFTGSNLSIVSLPDRRYFFAWEKNNVTTADPPIAFTNLEYAIINHYGTIIRPIGPLTDNSNVTIKTEDRSLYLAGLPNGRVGAIWVRTQSQRTNQSTLINSNIYFSVFTSSGQTVVQPINVTNNLGWHGPNDDVPIFGSPRIVASGGDRFILIWNDNVSHTSGTTKDLYTAIYDQNGNGLIAPTKLTNSAPSGMQYESAAPVSLNDASVLFAYVIKDTGSGQSLTAYQILDHEGAIVLTETVIPGSFGSTPDGIQIGNEHVLLAWNVPQTEELQYVVLSGSDFTNQDGPDFIENPKDRVVGYVSVTRDEEGHGILTWSEGEQSEYLSYALIDNNGVLLTPPMIFSTGLGDEPKIYTNTYGVGNAFYGGSWQTYLPVTVH